MRTADEWITLLIRCGCTASTASRWAPVFEAEIRPDTFSLGEAEIDDFLGQILHESAMLTRLEEGLSYRSAERIRAVWPSRFPTNESALPFVRNPQGLANRVYADRMGNTGAGDGWTYRGRGLIQVTGRDNYAALSRVLRLDLLGQPELLGDPRIALRASIAWWEGNVPDGIMGDIRKVTRRVNGGTHGLEHRAHVTDKARGALG